MITTLSIPPAAYAHYHRVMPNDKYDFAYFSLAVIGFILAVLVPEYVWVGCALMFVPVVPIFWRMTHDTETGFWKELNQDAVEEFCQGYIKSGIKLGLQEDEMVNDVLALRNNYFEQDAVGVLLCMAALGEKLATIEKVLNEDTSKTESLAEMEAALKELDDKIASIKAEVKPSTKKTKRQVKTGE